MPRPMLPELGSPCSKQVFCLIFYRENFPAIMFFFYFAVHKHLLYFQKTVQEKRGENLRLPSHNDFTHSFPAFLFCMVINLVHMTFYIFFKKISLLGRLDGPVSEVSGSQFQFRS